MALDRLTKIDGGGISTTSDYRVGVITASKFVGPIEGAVTGTASTATLAVNAQGLTGTPDITVGIITASSANFSGNVSIGGTLTYEDVTNIDAIGIITARNDIHVGAGLSVVGVSTLGSSGSVFLQHNGTERLRTSTAGVVINDAANIFNNGSNICVGGLGINASIFHNGDENTAMDFFPVNDRVRFRTGGGERLAITNTGIHFNVTGISTFEGNIDANGDLDVDGHTNLDNVSIAGVSTATGGSVFGNIQAGVAALNATIQKTDNGTLHLQYNKPGNLELCQGGGQVQVKNNFNVVGLSTMNGGAKLGNLSVGYDSLNVTIQPVSGQNTLHFNYNNGTEVRIGEGQTRSDLIVKGDIEPKTDSAFDLGTTSVRWRNLYADTLYGDGSQLTNLPTQVTISNNAAERVITGGSGTNLNGEQYLTFSPTSNNGLDVTRTNANTAAMFRGNGGAGSIGLYDTTNAKLLFLSNSNGDFDVKTSDGSYAKKLTVKQNGLIGVGVDAPTFSTINSVSGSNVLGIEIFQDVSDTATALKLAADNGSGNKAFSQLGYSGANATAHWANYNTSGTKVGEISITADGIIETGTAVGASGADGNQRLRVGRTGDCNIAVRATGSTTATTGIDFGDQDDDRAGRIQYVHDGNYMSFHTNGAGNGTSNEHVRINASGNLLIGTSSGNEKLVVKRNDTTGPTITLENDSNLAYINNWGSAGGGSGRTNRFEINATAQGQASYCAPYHTFMTGGVGDSYEKVRIASDGKVGINDSSPNRLLTVNNGTSNAQFVEMKNDQVGLFFGAYRDNSGSYPREATINGSRVDSGSSPYLRLAGQGGIKFCADLNSEHMVMLTTGRTNLGGGNSGQPLGALHINTSSTMGTDTALWIGDNANKRYMVINQVSGTEMFSHMELRYNDNASPALLRLSNPYAPAGYGTQIQFRGYNDLTQAYIETKSEAANSANSSLYIYSSNNKGLRIRHSGTVQAQEALVSRNGIVQINQVTSTTRYSGSIASVDILTGSNFYPKTNNPRFLIMIFCPVNTSDDSDAYGANTNPYHTGRIEYRKSGGGWIECNNQGDTSDQGGTAGHIELSPNRTGDSTTDYWSGNRYRMEHKTATILVTNVGDCGDGGTVQFKLRGYSSNHGSFVQIGQPHGFGTDDNYTVQPWGFTVFELAPDSNSYTPY